LTGREFLNIGNSKKKMNLLRNFRAKALAAIITVAYLICSVFVLWHDAGRDDPGAITGAIMACVYKIFI
jgi:hypothetical protein